MPKTLLAEATMTGFTPHADQSMTFRFRTQELSDDQKMDAITHYQQFGWLGFVDSEDATDLEIPEEAPLDTSKTPSQRLRSVLYVYHQQHNIKEPFQAWYTIQMEKFIESVKTRLED